MQSKFNIIDSKQKVAVIAAFCINTRAIGKNGKIPWNIPEDLHLFKKITSGSAVIFGRKTFESIGRPLPERFNIVLSRNNDFSAESVATAHSLQEGLLLAENAGYEKIFICGGAKVYEEGLLFANTIYATEVSGNFEGDAFFPEIPETFTETERTACSDGKYNWEFVTYQRKKS